MSKVKIAFIITRLQLGGAQKSVLYTARHLDNRFEPYLLTGMGGFLDGQAKSSLKNIIFIPHFQRALNPIKDITAFIHLAVALRKINPQIVHTNSSKAGILGRIAAKFFTRARIVHTVHGFGFNEKQNPLVRHAYIFAEKLCSKISDTVIFVSQANMDLALKLNITPAEKCRLVRAGVKMETRQDFAHTIRQQKLACLDVKEDSKIILSPANLKPQKNPLDMVRAAKIVCQKIPNAVFLYLGEGELKHKTQELIKEFKLENNFKLLGRRQDIAELLYISDVFALSSLWEGLPMALAEALNMQLPCVCYDADGIRELLKDGKNGYLIQKHDYEGLAKGIINILEGRLTFDVNAVNLKDFDADLMVQKQQKIYLNREEDL